MDHKNIFNYIILIIITIIILRYFTPNKESLLYILKIYLNYFIDKFKQLLSKVGLYNYIENFGFYGRTFQGIPNFELKAPIFNNNYDKFFINSYHKINPNISINQIQLLYNFINSLITSDTDFYYLTPSNESNKLLFTDDEKNKIIEILLNKLNSDIYKFENLEFLNIPTYTINFSGKDIEPLFISVDCDHNFNKLLIYIEIAIRNDVKQNIEYLVINDIKLLINSTDLKTDFTNNKDLYNNKNLMDDLHINYDNKIFEKTNYVDDFYLQKNNNVDDFYLQKNNNVGDNDKLSDIFNNLKPYNNNINYNVENYDL